MHIVKLFTDQKILTTYRGDVPRQNEIVMIMNEEDQMLRYRVVYVEWIITQIRDGIIRSHNSSYAIVYVTNE